MYIWSFYIVLYYAYIGFLDLSSESEDLKPGAKLELPLWLAQPLNKVRESIVSVDIPKTYKEGYRFVLVYIYVVELISVKENFVTVCFSYLL